MRIPLIRLFILTLTLVACTAVAYAQVQPADVTPTSTVTFDWKTVLATFLNTTLVVAVVAGINAFRPVIREQYPWAVPLMATILGPIVGVAQTWILAKLGITVDFSPIVAALAGAAATTVHQVGKQAKASV
jgi:hypothetical protein